MTFAGNRESLSALVTYAIRKSNIIFKIETWNVTFDQISNFETDRPNTFLFLMAEDTDFIAILLMCQFNIAS